MRRPVPHPVAMRRVRLAHLLALSAALAAALCGLAQAAVPRWSAPEEVARGAMLGGVGIDGVGSLTAVWELDAPGGGTRIATRTAGRRSFDPAQPLGPAGSLWPSVEVAHSGETRLGWRYDGAVTDLNKLAHRIVEEATDPDESSPTPAQTNGRNGGLKGGKARAAKLSPEKRSEIARKAARARWGDTAQ